MYFDQKLVSLYSNIRLLVRDEWIFLDKDPKADRQNIIELPRSVTKGLVACRDTAQGVSTFKMELPKQFDNITLRVIDDLKATLKSGSKVSMAAASFSIYAFEALQKELEQVGAG